MKLPGRDELEQWVKSLPEGALVGKTNHCGECLYAMLLASMGFDFVEVLYSSGGTTYDAYFCNEQGAFVKGDVPEEVAPIIRAFDALGPTSTPVSREQALSLFEEK